MHVRTISFLCRKHWKFLIHTKIAYDLKVHRDLDSRSFGQGQGHIQKTCNIRVWSKKIYEESLEVHKIAHDLKVCHDHLLSVVLLVKMFTYVFSYNPITSSWKEFSKTSIYTATADEFDSSVMLTRPNVTFAAIRSGIVYLFLFVVLIAYILVFFRPLSVNSAKAFLIISTIYEITILAFLVLGKRKFKSQFRETFIEEKPSTCSGYKIAFLCITFGAVAFEMFGGIAGLMKAREFFCFLLFINKILQISVMITQSEFILHAMNKSFQTRAIQEKQLKVNRIFQCIFFMNILKWIVNTIIMGQKTDASFIQRQFYGKKYWDIIKYTIFSVNVFYRFLTSLEMYGLYRNTHIHV